MSSWKIWLASFNKSLAMLSELTANLDFIIYQTKNHASYLAMIAGLPTLFFFVNLILGRRLFYLGLVPRTGQGLIGIVFAPLLHANFQHLFFNLLPLVVLSDFILLQGLNFYLKITAMITLISGFLIWCLGKRALYIGASALITGYWGFLVGNIFQQRDFRALILGLLSIYYFAGIFFGLFPGKKGVSWQGHLLGLIAGFICSTEKFQRFLLS